MPTCHQKGFMMICVRHVQIALSLFYLYTFLIFCILCSAQKSFAFDENLTKILSEIAGMHKENLQRLRQWNGSAEVIGREVRTADSYDCTIRSEVAFSMDQDKDSVCFNWDTVASSALANGGGKKIENSLNGYRLGGLRVGEDLYQMQLTAPNNFSTVTLDPAIPINAGPMTQVFYPLFYFQLNGQEGDAFFSDYRKLLSESWFNITISRENDLVEVVGKNNNLPGVYMKYVFDVSKGGNLVKYVGHDTVSESITATDYSKMNNVFVPTNYQYRQERHDHSKINEKKVLWRDQRVNEPIPEEAFTLAAMGVPAGAQIVDTRLNQVSIYKPPGTADSSPLVSKSNKKLSSRAPVIAAVSLLIACVWMFILWTRKRSV